MKQVTNPLVCKFGGTVFPGRNYSKEFSDAANCVLNQQERGYTPIGVVSAPKGITDMLLGMWEEKHGPVSTFVYWDVANLREKCHKMSEGHDDLCQKLEGESRKLEELLIDRREKDKALLIGENISGICLSAAITRRGHESVYLDGYEAGVVVNPSKVPQEEKSITNIRKKLNRHLDTESKTIPIIGGYGGKCSKTRRHKLMGRNSTDVTGALVAAATGATKYEIIKKVSGIYRVEPEFGNYGTIPSMHYDEAIELGWRGVRVVHPSAVRVAKKYNIPIHVKNLEGAPGTLISNKTSTTKKRPVAAISASHFYMLTVLDEIMDVKGIGTGYLSQISGILSNHKIDIFNNFSSSFSISVIISPSERVINGEPVEQILERSLRKYGRKPERIEGKTVGGINIVGKGIKGRRGTLAEVSGALAKNGVNVVAGTLSDEARSPNMVFCVDKKLLKRSVSALCKKLFS